MNSCCKKRYPVHGETKALQVLRAYCPSRRASNYVSVKKQENPIGRRVFWMDNNKAKRSLSEAFPLGNASGKEVCLSRGPANRAGMKQTKHGS